VFQDERKNITDDRRSSHIRTSRIDSNAEKSEQDESLYQNGTHKNSVASKKL
jgi:hypothetical protein